ncbi:glutamine ABC transporter permease [Bifidobacterium lemurum]|uniref:Glutamine ABC transporter permease n=1 Tax=Bifidobacterium lemurum TaxID=1603886 RepID=A0A261FK69_9BIFI|nr:glutamine ABC transporter permease GlnP [Bifidobacterium lemurum]OZG59561.1 glutamine ABC transporter permease [Bifidobacterium lemurum]QOL35013.1 glutamine ABC transporter permease GlnP [Bifidobacterium lemurum]
MSFDWSVIIESLPSLISGAGVTLQIAVTGLIGGLAIGVLLGLVRAYAPKIFNVIALAYIELIRGTPIIVQVMFIYFAIPIMFGVRVDAMVAAVTAITINSSAYIAELVRGAYLALPKGLTEAGLAMGLPFGRVLLEVLSPVAVRRLIPSLGNQFIISLKDTSLFTVISVAELTRTGQEIMAANFKAVEVWTAVAVLYLVMTGTLSVILRLTERKMRIL